MARESIRYRTASPPRKSVDPVPSSKKIAGMAGRADDTDDTQEPPQTQKGVASPMRVLHKTPGLSPQEYQKLLQKMIGDSVINTYATFAELIVEKIGRTDPEWHGRLAGRAMHRAGRKAVGTGKGVAQAEKAAKAAVDERMKARKAKKKALESMRGQGVKGTRTRDNTTKDLGDVFDPDENA